MSEPHCGEEGIGGVGMRGVDYSRMSPQNRKGRTLHTKGLIKAVRILRLTGTRFLIDEEES